MPLCAALNYFKNKGGKIVPNKYNQTHKNHEILMIERKRVKSMYLYQIYSHIYIYIFTSPQLRTLQTKIPLSLRSLFPLHSLGSVKGTADLQALEDEAMFGRTWSNRIYIAIQNKFTNMFN